MGRRTSYKGRKSLVLNADFSCMALISVRKALSLSIKNQYDSTAGLNAIDYYDEKVLSAGGIYFPYPSVLTTTKYIRPKRQKVSFSRNNLFLRDNFTCMYCGEQDVKAKSLTYDHVIPRAIWKRQNHKTTPTQWLNITTACKKCNTKKANRTPKQADMKLKMEPFEPNPHNHLLGFSPWMKIEEAWKPYLPKIYKNLLEKM